jgi:DNA-binding transcriptional regulator YiaG
MSTVIFALGLYVTASRLGWPPAGAIEALFERTRDLAGESSNHRRPAARGAGTTHREKELIANDTRELGPNEHPDMRQVVHDAIASEIETLRRQIHHYERLRDGHITSHEITSLRELPTVLIEARIAAKLTQRQLAERIDVAEQQIQRWETNDYHGVNLSAA